MDFTTAVAQAINGWLQSLASSLLAPALAAAFAVVSAAALIALSAGIELEAKGSSGQPPRAGWLIDLARPAWPLSADGASDLRTTSGRSGRPISGSSRCS